MAITALRGPMRDAVPAVAAAAMGLWGLGGPSLWRDESVSAMAGRMPLGELRTFLGDLDAVHALYYLLLRPFAAGGEVALRLPSVLAFVAAAYGVGALGRRLAGPAAGVCGGVIYALTPIAVRYAQEARSYALVSAVAVLAMWLLVERRQVAYGASVALLGWLHLYALLLVPAHLVAGRRVLLPLAGAAVAVAPLAVVAAGQREAQVFWLQRPGLGELAGFPVEVAGSVPAAIVLFGLAAWGGRRAPAVAAWAVLPVAASLLISQVQPVYHPRYVLFVVPAIALLAGIGAAELGRNWRAGVAVGLFAALTASTHVAIRQPASRPDDLRSLAAVLAAEQRPGDRVLFVPRRFRLFVAAYGEPYQKLVDLTPQPVSAVGGAERVWLVSPRIGRKYAADERYQELRRGHRAGAERVFGTIRLTLYQDIS